MCDCLRQHDGRCSQALDQPRSDELASFVADHLTFNNGQAMDRSDDEDARRDDVEMIPDLRDGVDLLAPPALRRRRAASTGPSSGGLA